MKQLSIRELIKRASNLNEEKQIRFLEDIPIRVLVSISIRAWANNLNVSNPRLYELITTICDRRYKEEIEHKTIH